MRDSSELALTLPGAGAERSAAEVSGGQAAVEIVDLRVDYGATVAVDGLSLRVEPGQIYGLVGPNGAGKTTTFEVVTTLLQPTYGRVSVCGVDVAARPEDAHRLLGYMPDLAPVPSDLTVLEFLELFGRAHGLRERALRERIAECLLAVELTDRRSSWCRELSRGMMQRLVLAKTLLHQPQVMVLDEPASGMDPRSRNALKRALRAMAREGVTVLVSSHILSELAELCTHLGLLRRGRLLRSGTVAQVLEDFESRGRLLLRLEASAAQELEAWLSQRSELLAWERLGSDQWELQLPQGARFEAEILRELVQSGLPLRGFWPRQATLEEVVLALDETEDQPGGRG